MEAGSARAAAATNAPSSLNIEVEARKDHAVWSRLGDSSWGRLPTGPTSNVVN
jgi:hypothetical protein